MARRIDRAREAYLDTSAFVAFPDRSDSRHPVYRRLLPALVIQAFDAGELMKACG